jgi:hypothetical protein
MKPYTTIQLNVKVTDTTADQIKRLAAFNQITVAEQLRRFIEEGLSVNQQRPAYRPDRQHHKTGTNCHL